KEKEEAQSLHFLKEKESIIIKQNLILEERVQERNKELLKTNEILDSQKEKIEEQISKIEKSNKELKKFNKKLSSKNSKILIKNEELQLFKKSLEETIKEKTYDLKKAKKRAIIAEKLKSSFLNNMTNEIKDPINNITGFSNLLLDKNLTEIKRNEYLNIIIHNVDKLLEQIDDIVTISRIQTGIVKLREESFDMNSIFDPLIEEFNEKLKFWDKKLKIIKRIPENIKIKADYNKLWTILHKLIGNSIKYTKSGTIELGFNKIDLNKSFQNFINLEIFIKDTGSGFETEKLNKLFIRLNEIHEDKTKIYHEIGTGLAIVKGYVDILKGNISVESKINEGTIFLIEIPVLVL
ncbi:MAG: hypothetical protein JXR51_07705, partial [Bacteroidales bacterium]|nr:hypothetical protein [Bacteroidales bacterium]